MTPDEAAQLLGVPAGASPAAIEAAYRAKARETHPDRFAGQQQAQSAASAREFIAASEARRTLLSAATAASPAPQVTFVRGVRRRSPLLLATWVGLLVIAAFLSIYASALPLGIVEPVVRFAVIIGALVAYALTGLRGWLVTALIALAATAVLAIVFTTIGALLGMLLMVAPVFGLMLMGVETAKRR